MLGVLLLTVFYDLMTAVILGVFITNIVTIDRLTRIQLDGLFVTDGQNNNEMLNDEEKSALLNAQGSILLFHLDGPMSFGVAHAMKQQLEDFKNYQSLILDFSKASIVGVTTILVIEDIIQSAKDHDKAVYLTGINDTLHHSFSKLGVFSMIPQQHHLNSRIDAIKAIEISS